MVPHQTVSRCHAELTVKNDTLFVRDLGSRNGTYIAGKLVQFGFVLDGQSVRFADVDFLLTVGELAKSESFSAETASLKPAIKVATNETTPIEISKAEVKVLKAAQEGLSEKEIALRLHLSPHTVHHHMSAIYAKYEVHSRAELLAKLLKRAEFKKS